MASPSHAVMMVKQLEEENLYLSNTVDELREKNSRLHEQLCALTSDLIDHSNAIGQRDRRILELSSREELLNGELLLCKHRLLVLEENKESLIKVIKIKDASFDELKTKFDSITK
jgi:chromosome segregation ATPase